MTRPEMEEEAQRLCQKLGGGWSWEHGLIVVISLTMSEAQALEQRLDAS